MNDAKALQALLMAQEAQRIMNAPASQSTLQPRGPEMGAIGHPNGPLPPAQYQPFNRV